MSRLQLFIRLRLLCFSCLRLHVPLLHSQALSFDRYGLPGAFLLALLWRSHRKPIFRYLAGTTRAGTEQVTGFLQDRRVTPAPLAMVRVLLPNSHQRIQPALLDRFLLGARRTPVGADTLPVLAPFRGVHTGLYVLVEIYRLHLLLEQVLVLLHVLLGLQEDHVLQHVHINVVFVFIEQRTESG